jgi:hypothetical protein
LEAAAKFLLYYYKTIKWSSECKRPLECKVEQSICKQATRS